MACRFREEWLIDGDPAIDIATFDITPERIKLIKCAVLTGLQKSWPPVAPKPEERIYYCGFPGSGRVWPPPLSEIRFGAVVSSGAASSVSDLDISTHINRESLHPILGSRCAARRLRLWRDERRSDAHCRREAPTLLDVSRRHLPGTQPIP